MNKKLFNLLLSLVLIASFATPVLANPPAAPAAAAPNNNSAIFFVADGMRQDLAETFASQGIMRGLAKLLRNGSKAADNGLLTQAPPNTGAGWYSLATGAWAGVHGSTNNTFFINGQPFGNRTGSFR
jgi:predicted AlkP superfamily pyrophosphatase or phosphodiesterase